MKNLESESAAWQDKIKSNRNSFDEDFPQEGHEARFLEKLDKELEHTPKRKMNWLKIAASLIILIGLGPFLLMENNTEKPAKFAEKEEYKIPLEEAEYYYQNSYKTQFDAMAKNYTDDESKKMIEESQELILNLQKDYKELEEELKITADQRVATAMILNYKSRISILETLIQKLEYVKQLKRQKDENINA